MSEQKYDTAAILRWYECERKIAYGSAADADQARSEMLAAGTAGQDGRDPQPYFCLHRRHWHLGTLPKGGTVPPRKKRVHSAKVTYLKDVQNGRIPPFAHGVE